MVQIQKNAREQRALPLTRMRGYVLHHSCSKYSSERGHVNRIGSDLPYVLTTIF
jgi:hypothetical protein